MTDVATVGLDLEKNVFQVHAAEADGRAGLRHRVRRAEVLRFFAALSPRVVEMEACASSHCWAREIGRLGHEVMLMPPAYVKP